MHFAAPSTPETPYCRIVYTSKFQLFQMKGKPSSHQKTDGAHKTYRGRSGKGFNRSSSTESNAKVNVREKKSNLIGRGLKAPVKKIPNVHSSSGLVASGLKL